MFKVSVVIPTYNRLHRLEQVLDAFAQQTFAHTDFEILVISDGSSDGTHEYLAQLTTPYRLNWRTQANQGPAVARNTGIAQAQGEYILFVDDDVVPTATLIAEHMRITTCMAIRRSCLAQCLRHKISQCLPGCAGNKRCL